MKKCSCGASKWYKFSNYPDNHTFHRCLKCYAVYSNSELKKLKDKNERTTKN